jgi:hypothetical protein
MHLEDHPLLKNHRNSLFLMIVILLLLVACSTNRVDVKPANSTAEKVTDLPTEGETHPTSTSTAIPFTQTPAASPTEVPGTPTLGPTATPDLFSDLNTKFDPSVDLDKLPVHSLDELTSGKLTNTEKRLDVMFSESTTKADIVISDLKNRFAIADFNPAYKDYTEYNTPANVPFKGASANMFEIDGQKVLVIGFLWLNADNTTSVIHVGVQNWKNKTWIGYFFDAYKSTRRLGIISRIYDANFVFSDWIDFKNNPVISQMYAADNSLRSDLIQQWVRTDQVPGELENLLLMPATARWR